MSSSSNMDDTIEVNLELEPIHRFVIDAITNSYIYCPASEGIAESYKTQERQLAPQEKFYKYQQIDSRVKNLNVEGLKYTSRLKEEILQLLLSFDLRLHVLKTDMAIEALLLLPYERLCQVLVKGEVEHEAVAIPDPYLDEILEGPNLIDVKRNNPSVPLVQFRMKVIKLLGNYIIYDKNKEETKQKIMKAVRSCLTPEFHLITMIENRRSAYTYTRVREKILAKLSSEDREYFGSGRNLNDFLKSLDNLVLDNLSNTYFQNRKKFMDLDKIIRIGDEGDGSREATTAKLYDYGEEFRKFICQFRTNFTAEQQLVLFNYQWIKTWFTALRQQFVNRQGASDPELEVLKNLMSVQDMFEMEQGDLKFVEKILTSRQAAIESCRLHDEKVARMKADRAATTTESSPYITHNYNTMVVRIPKNLEPGDKRNVRSLVRKVQSLLYMVIKPETPWKLTLADQAMLNKYKDEKVALQAKKLVKDGWLVYSKPCKPGKKSSSNNP